MEKIREINKAVKEYFDTNKSVNKVRAKDLMSWFIKKGIFEKDTKNGLPIRRILRELDDTDQLHRAQKLYVERKTKNRYWFFVRSPSGDAEAVT